MGLVLRLDEKLSDGLWKAVGSFSNSAGHKGSAEVLVRSLESNQFILTLDSGVFVSKIMNREVTSYGHVENATIKGAPKKGAELCFNQFTFSLKKIV
jgi:hypothetical protein